MLTLDARKPPSLRNSQQITDCRQRRCAIFSRRKAKEDTRIPKHFKELIISISRDAWLHCRLEIKRGSCEWVAGSALRLRQESFSRSFAFSWRLDSARWRRRRPCRDQASVDYHWPVARPAATTPHRAQLSLLACRKCLFEIGFGITCACAPAVLCFICSTIS